MGAILASVLFGATAALWLFLGVQALRGTFRLRRLPAGSAGAGKRPRVSVVVAARDEEARIETTVRRLLAQEGVDLELLVVDDRSRDGTSAILRRLAGEDARLRVLRVDELPEGWLGKCHACHVGAAAMTGDWLLFTDGDIWLKPDVLTRAVRAAEAEGADHVTLMPGVSGATFLGHVCQLIFALGLNRRMVRVNGDRPNAYLGIGAFNLVRAEAYRASGGYERLRLEVADDVKLGLLLHRAGRRTRVFFAPDDVDADWSPGMVAMVRDLEKNHFAMAGYRLTPVLLMSALFLLFWGAALVGPWTGLPAGLAAGAGLLALTVPACRMAALLGLPVRAGLLVPLLLPVMPVCLLRSAALTLWRGGVRWRDTFYPLATLRAAMVR
jgi:glycosyltransferase involved in cell wall biosynthesis